MAPRETAATHDTDRLLAFTIGGRQVRGRVTRVDDVLNRILGTHSYPDQIAALLADAVALAALLGGLLRSEDGQVTMQARGEGGPINLLVVDYRGGEIRGYVAFDLDRRLSDDASLAAMFGGEGHLVITLDQALSKERYQGIVALEGKNLTEAIEAYFASSEQLPTLLRIASARRPDGKWVAGGLVIQQMPGGEQGRERLSSDAESRKREEDWAHVSAFAGSLKGGELTDSALPLEDLLWRLFHEEEVRVFPEQPLTQGCRCSVAHLRAVLQQFPEDDRVGMRNDEGMIVVDCEFCARQFQLDV